MFPYKAQEVPGSAGNYNFTFTFPNIDASSQVYLKADVVARSSTQSTFSISCGNANLLLKPPVASTKCYYCEYALPANGSAKLTPSSSQLLVSVNFNKPVSDEIPLGWLNFLELNARRYLIMSGNQMQFRDIKSVGAGTVSNFTLHGISAAHTIWDVTNVTDVKRQTKAMRNLLS